MLLDIMKENVEVQIERWMSAVGDHWGAGRQSETSIIEALRSFGDGKNVGVYDNV